MSNANGCTDMMTTSRSKSLELWTPPGVVPIVRPIGAPPTMTAETAAASLLRVSAHRTSAHGPRAPKSAPKSTAPDTNCWRRSTCGLGRCVFLGRGSFMGLGPADVRRAA